MTETDDVNVPAIAIDGVTGSGKGTVRGIVAKKLGFNQLDSGVLYRALALVSIRKGISGSQNLAAAAACLHLKMVDHTVFLDGVDETVIIRSDEMGKAASIVAQIPEVRAALRGFQLSMRTLPGLVADGRDQGEIFDTRHRFFLEASAEIRAKRRVEQFTRMDLSADYETILAEINRRDESDFTRKVSPLKIHPRAWRIDTSNINAEETAEIILAHYGKPF